MMTQKNNEYARLIVQLEQKDSEIEELKMEYQR